MKINKIRLKILHFFNLSEAGSVEHFDDLKVNVILNEEQKLKVLEDKEEADLVVNIKSQILSNFQIKKSLEERCEKMEQVWVTFYDIGQKRVGSITKCLRYVDGILYYPRVDSAAYKRDQKLKNILSK